MFRRKVRAFINHDCNDPSFRLISSTSFTSHHEALFNGLELNVENAFFNLNTHTIGVGSLLTPVIFSASHNDLLLTNTANGLMDREEYDQLFVKLFDYFESQSLELKKAVFPHYQLCFEPLDLPKGSLYSYLGASLSSFLSTKDNLLWHKRFCDLQLLLNESGSNYNGIWSWAKCSHPLKEKTTKDTTLFTDDPSLLDYQATGLEVLPLENLTKIGLKRSKNIHVLLKEGSDKLTDVKKSLKGRTKLIIHAKNGVWS